MMRISKYSDRLGQQTLKKQRVLRDDLPFQALSLRCVSLECELVLSFESWMKCKPTWGQFGYRTLGGFVGLIRQVRGGPSPGDCGFLATQPRQPGSNLWSLGSMQSDPHCLRCHSDNTLLALRPKQRSVDPITWETWKPHAQIKEGRCDSVDLPPRDEYRR